jgi:hypothetical protein
VQPYLSHMRLSCRCHFRAACVLGRICAVASAWDRPDHHVLDLLSLRETRCVFGIFAAFASPGTTSGTPTERVTKGDNALKLVMHRPCQTRFGTDMLQTTTLLRVRIRMPETLAA